MLAEGKLCQLMHDEVATFGRLRVDLSAFLFPLQMGTLAQCAAIGHESFQFTVIIASHILNAFLLEKFVNGDNLFLIWPLRI